MEIKGKSLDELVDVVSKLHPQHPLRFKIYVEENSVPDSVYQEAIKGVACCDTFLNPDHTTDDVERFIARVFRLNKKYFLKKMLSKGRNRFLCTLVGAMAAADFYNSQKLCELPSTLSRHLKIGNVETAARYLKRGKSKFEREFLL